MARPFYKHFDLKHVHLHRNSLLYVQKNIARICAYGDKMPHFLWYTFRFVSTHVWVFLFILQLIKRLHSNSVVLRLLYWPLECHCSFPIWFSLCAYAPSADWCASSVSLCIHRMDMRTVALCHTPISDGYAMTTSIYKSVRTRDTNILGHFSIRHRLICHHRRSCLCQPIGTMMCSPFVNYLCASLTEHLLAYPKNHLHLHRCHSIRVNCFDRPMQIQAVVHPPVADIMASPNLHSIVPMTFPQFVLCPFRRMRLHFSSVVVVVDGKIIMARWVTHNHTHTILSTKLWKHNVKGTNKTENNGEKKKKGREKIPNTN